ncbi:MAG: MOSC domain-containing protein [Gemmatimonadales bacterium]
MHAIGTIVRLQIQRASLKTGDKPQRRYDPAPLLAVPRLQVTPDGVLGAARDADAWIVDVHHRAHPATKNEDGLHGVSVGFTSHYAALRERFGERIAVGCAGENIIIAATRRFAFEDLQHGLAIVDADGGERVRLNVLDVARPCRPFTGWALGQQVEPEVLKDSLRFLDAGMRGFYCLGVGNGTVSIGDQVVVLQDGHD